MEASRDLAASLVMIGFDGPDLPDDARSLIAAGIGGVILFARNAGPPEAVRTLCETIHAAAPRPLLLAVDQEGGEVQRFTDGFTDIPAMRTVDASKAPGIGETLARELRAVGVNFDLAPVLDVDTNPQNPVIGARSFSANPQEVARCAGAVIEALQSGGVAACGKHFPGHGDTTVDSHHDLPVVDHDRARLDAIELVPFRAAAAAGVAAIMTAHVVVRSIDRERPATLSPHVLGILRREIGFTGLIVSDDLEMDAIAERHDVADAAVAAIGAGVDLVLCCHRIDRQRRVIDRLAEAIDEDASFRARAEDAAARVRGVAAQYAV